MASDLFDSKYKALNKAQKEAVDTIEGPVMVIAGPGTGKTTVLTLRIANILKRTDTPANGILAITYTDAGVKAMREKLRAVIGNRAHEVEIHTFHSFALAMMAEYPDHFLHISHMEQMSDVEQETLVRKIISNKKFKDLRPSGRPDAYVHSIIRSIEQAKREALGPKDVAKFAKEEIERIKSDESSISTRGATKGRLKADALERIERCEKTMLFSKVYEEYEEDKKRNEKLDWADLILELLFAMKNDELFLRLLQERFLYIHVDEHQDTNDAQNFIIALLAEFFETPNIFIVGDEKQAIYRFQGASVENFLLLRKRWPKMKLISLASNYRSHQSILDAGFSMIENNYGDGEHTDLRVRLSSEADEEPRPVEIVMAEDASGLEDYLVTELKRVSESEPGASIAVIVRRNSDLDRVIRLLESANVPVSSQRSVDIFNHPIGLIFFSLAEFLADASRYDSLARTLSVGLWNLPFGESVSLIRDLRAEKLSGIDSKLPGLKKLRDLMLEDSPIGFLIHMAEESGFARIVSKNPSYIPVWRGIMTLAETLVRDGGISDPLELLNAMLAYKQSAESKSVKISVGAPDLQIRAMTAHGSKGLEFDYVFIAYATEESWIGRRRGASFVLPTKIAADGDQRDVRRLFYVALTRAKKHVSILVPLQESDGRVLTPLRFIEELDKGSVSPTNLPRKGTSTFGKIAKSAENDYGNKITALAKEVLTTTGLSVTALNHYLECPNKFVYESILKMPQAPSATAEKGTAMHAALAEIWQSEDRNAKSIEKIIVEASAKSLDESFLSPSEKESVKLEISEDAGAVAKALESHFGVRGPVYAEKWQRVNFGSAYNGEHIVVPIHGKLDAIVESGSEVEVYDYKTRQGMSIAAIRGETQGSDGNYFRQLVFYKLLLQGDFRFRNRKASTSLVFVVPDQKGRCPIVTLPVGETDIKELEKSIHGLIQEVWAGKLAHATCDKNDCEYCSLKSLLAGE